MKKKLYVIGTTVVLTVALVSCGGRKNTGPSRFYHALNSRYNIYFNGKTSFDEALQSMTDGYRENYTEQIRMFPVSGIYKEEKSNTGGPFDRAIEKGNKAIKMHSIKEKPRRKPGWQNDPKQIKLQAQEEFNPFMKHCWMLIGEGQFYNGDFLTSAVTFSYIARHFATDRELVAEARIWQARCYTELDWFYETNNALKKLNESGVPPKLQKKYDRMYADYLIRSEQLEQAIPYLQNSILSERSKRQRARMRYLLGQIYMATDQNEAAYRTFGKVASSNPPYEIEFAARIRQTEVFPGGNYNKVLKMLKRMSKSDKNKDFLDQVFYAMGNVYMTQQDTAKAIECYAEGIEKSTQNGMDKAICQIRLGDIYFTQKDYLKAQPCFSGALAGIQKEYKDYERVSRLSETLDELTVYYEDVHLQDSLQELARMPESERLAAIDKIIEQVIEEEKKAEEEALQEEYLARQASMGSNLPAARNINMPAIAAGPGDNSFYFYNQQVVAQGKNQFQNKWGKRTLEDNWRRRNKKIALLPEAEGDGLAEAGELPDELSEELSLQSDSLQAMQDSLASDPKSREYYLQQIPLTEDDLEASNLIIENGLFNMGMIYKDKLEDINLSVETFEDLERRFPDNKYKLDYYYQIYLMALRYKDTALAGKYKDKMLAEFPESDYTVAISDPNYEYNIRMMDRVQDSVYEATYERYLAEDIAAVRRNYQEFSSKYPLAALMPKFMFLNALTFVQEGDAEGFKDALTLLSEKYPDADVAELVNEMLKGLLRGRKLMQGGFFSTMVWDLRFGMGEDGVLSAADSARTFLAEEETPHRMLLLYTTGSIDRNQLLYTVAAYNFANFRVKGFDLSFEETGTLTILTISGFEDLREIIDYYLMICGADGYAAALDATVTFFPISDKNYDVLMHGKTLEEYMRFFVENYGSTAPDLVNRWRIRVDTDREEAAEKAAENEQGADNTESERKPSGTTAEPTRTKAAETIEKEQGETKQTTEKAATGEAISVAEQAAEQTGEKAAETTPLSDRPKEEAAETTKPQQTEQKEMLQEGETVSETQDAKTAKPGKARSVRKKAKKQKSELTPEEQKLVDELLAEDAEEEKRPKAKGDNLFRKLFKRLKETNEFKKIEESVQTIKDLAAEEETLSPADTVVKEKPLERVDGELTFEQIQEIRKREAEEAAVKTSEETLSKDEAKKAAEALKKQQAQEKEALRKQKEKEAKVRLQQKEKERKQKEKERKAALKQREKERKAAQKEKAKSGKAARKAKEAQSKNRTKKK
ncbi:MAG: tetratricopeptide repeat protein [Tannerella sp.]|nr:tetratricopeptide repeat protein [Tannerella sp.]